MMKEVQAVTYVNYFLTQLAGEVGFVSLGLGKDFKKYSIAGMYGVVPAEVAGDHSIETVTMRQTYTFFQGNRLSFHGGLNIFHVLGLSYQTTKFRDSPKAYYPIGSIRGLLNLGLTLRMRKERSFYFESGMNDIWITNWITNSSVVDPVDHLSLALGFKQSF